jgi:saccharopine dehydrogenase-like NADP-dependent oxidoreductase
MIKVAVLGGGLVGTPIALDLNKDENILVKLADINENHLTRARAEGIDCYQMDILEEGQLEDFVKDVHYVINALPGEIGYQSLKRAVLTGKSGVDIAFYPEDFSELQELAMERGVCWVVDMGVAPGMSHLLSAYGTTQLDETDDIKIYVGGLPKDTNSYWQYKAPFSPSDVLEEYTRPARFIRNGEEMSMPALSENELLSFPVVGELEAFNSDGLRSLMKSLKVENMIEKTLRYPGYVDKINVLKETGLFSQTEKDVKGVKVKPLDLTSQLLFSQWKLREDEVDFTVMQVKVKGKLKGEECTVVYNLYDEFDQSTRIHSMARTTGYAATSVLRVMIDGLFSLPGVHAPEMLAFHENVVAQVLDHLKKRGIIYEKVIE